MDEKKLTSSEALVYTYMVVKRNLKSSIKMIAESDHYFTEDTILLCEYVYKLNELRKSLEDHAENQKEFFEEHNDSLPMPLQVMVLIADCAEIEEEMLPVSNLSVAIH